ncbi:MAG: PEGA domain-containing protein [Sandaracinaceae bacterium]|nr:PEGA domain-containing protein [Sandaracinaceae bacterium]
MALPAEAQRASRPSRAAIEQARGRMEQGQAYFLQGRFAEAAAEFDAAYGIHPFSAFLFNAGVAYETGGDLTHAVDYFERYVRVETNASERAEVEARIATLRTRIQEHEAQLARERAEREAAEAAGREPPPPVETTEATPTAPSAQVVDQLLSLVAVESEPEGATVTITNASGTVATGPAPLTQTLEHGAYHIVIEHPDYNRFERDFDVQPGVLNRLFLNLSQGEFLGYVRVLSDPPGAGVIIDDREHGARGQTPFEGPLQAGHHRVWIERQGYDAVEREFDIAVGDEVRVDVDLERVSYGRLRVVGNLRGARILIDGIQVGAVPWEGQVEGGTHIVRVEHDNMKAWESTVEVARGQLRPIRVRLRPAMGRGGAIAAGVIGGLFLGGAIGMSIYVNDLYAELDRARTAGTLQADDERLQVGYWMSIGQWVAYGVAGLGAALSLFYAFYDDLPPSEGTVLDPRDWTVLPMFSPGGSSSGDVFGLTLSGVL